MSPEEQIAQTLKNLMQSIQQHDKKAYMRWHKVLYHIGQPAVPSIVSKLVTFHDAALSQHLKLLYCSGLMRLLHDINEEESRNVAQRLRRQGGDMMITNRLQAITDFTLTQFSRYIIRGVTIFEDNTLNTAFAPRPFLEKWFTHVPDADIREIDRIYIVSRDEQDYEGTYLPIYYSIHLVWDILPFSRHNPITWFMLLMKEQTFYHEVGHHAHRHTFGYDLDQEKEANQYAAQFLRRHHPLVAFFNTVLWKVLPRNVKQENEQRSKYCQ